MLKKINRGLNSKEIKEILETGKTIQTPLFGVRFKLPPNPLFDERGGENTNIRFGWIISKKISKRAVDRNKIKRRLAETINKLIRDGEFGMRNYEIIFLVKKIILDVKIEEIENQVKYVFEKIGFKNSNIV